MSARVEVDDGRLVVEIAGLDRLWALNSGLTVPVDRVKSARVVERKDAPRTTLRWPGTYLPGLIKAGSYRGSGRRSLWCVHRGHRLLVIDLSGTDYDHVVVEVDDPDAIAAAINQSLSLTS